MSIRHCLLNRCDFDDFSHVITCPPQILSLIHASQLLKWSLSLINDAQYEKKPFKKYQRLFERKKTNYVHIILIGSVRWLLGSNDPIKNGKQHWWRFGFSLDVFKNAKVVNQYYVCTFFAFEIPDFVNKWWCPSLMQIKIKYYSACKR